jgi:hypothetical protein
MQTPAAARRALGGRLDRPVGERERRARPPSAPHGDGPSEAFAHCQRLRAHRCRVVWVERKVIQLRLTGGTRALIANRNVCALVQVEHGVAEKLLPLLFFLLIPTVVGVVVASKLQHMMRFLSLLCLTITLL